MHKILIKGYFKNYDINEKIKYKNHGFLLSNFITFKNNNDKIKINFKNDKILFTKENNNSKLVHEFILNENTTGKYKIKSQNILIDIPIYTTKIENKNKSVKIEYNFLNNESKTKNIIYIEDEVLA